MADYLEDIEGEEKSHGGICGNSISILPANANHVFPDVIQDKITGPLNPGSGFEFETFFGQEFTFRFNEVPQEVQGGIVYISTLSARASKDKIDRVRQIDRLMREGFILKFTDANEITKLMGAVRNGAYLRYERDNKALINETNEFVISWTWTNRRPVPEYAES